MFVAVWYLNADLLLAIFHVAVHLAVFLTEDELGDVDGELMSFFAESPARSGDLKRFLTGLALCGVGFEVVKNPMLLIVDRPGYSSDDTVGKIDL